MRILHLPFTYYPDSVGGTEVYVASLAQELIESGCAVAVAAPGDENKQYEHDDVPVYRYQIQRDIQEPLQLYNHNDPIALHHFEEVLNDYIPDIVHMHALTAGVSLTILRAATKRDIPVVFTYHTPTVSCMRGQLLKWGVEVCDGILRQQLCSACTLNQYHIPSPVARLLGSLPPGTGAIIGRVGLKRGIWNSVRMSQYVATRHQITRSVFAEADSIIALCEWTRDLLLRNNVSRKKITLVRHGLSIPCELESKHSQKTISKPLKLAFFGRFSPEKGLHLIVEAIASLSSRDVELHVFGVAYEDDYGQKIIEMASRAVNIHMRGAIPNSKVIETLVSFDALLVPSIWLETGPLVVLEAFAAGIPVIGTNLGGIQELVQDGVDGILVNEQDAASWQTVIADLIANPKRLIQLRAGVKSPRRMKQVTVEMMEIYHQHVHS